jgi:predicted HAD superfamily Cof-like phosphohydrolase
MPLTMTENQRSLFIEETKALAGKVRVFGVTDAATCRDLADRVSELLEVVEEAEAETTEARQRTHEAREDHAAVVERMYQLDYQAKVREFHTATGAAVSATPTTQDASTRALRCRLMLEELKEFIQASGCRLIGAGDLLDVHSVVGAKPDLPAMGQELSDMQYTLSGTAEAHGLPLTALFAEVHAANMRKVGPDGRARIQADGKVLKPDGWRPPDVAAVLKRHGWALVLLCALSLSQSASAADCAALASRRDEAAHAQVIAWSRFEASTDANDRRRLAAEWTTAARAARAAEAAYIGACHPPRLQPPGGDKAPSTSRPG